ncbi:MAG TPA: M36 family metallopeptidase [Nocardioidaceae bacterium]|nr:M36 family metallopeptidase [Nocardioidaceae bacterium]
MAHDLDAQDFSRSTTTEERLAELNRLAAQIASTSGLFGTAVPHFVVQQLGAQTRNPSVITFATHPRTAAGLRRMTDGDLVSRATELVETIAPVLGIAGGQTAEFSANTNVTDVAGAVRVVRLAQQYQGIEIFHAQSALHFSVDDQPSTLLGKTFTVPGVRLAEPGLTAAEAVLSAAAFVTPPPATPENDQFGNQVNFPPVDLIDFVPRRLAQGHGADRTAVFDGGPFATPIRTRLLWFPRTLDELRLAWEVELLFRDGGARYRSLVDAQTGEMLYARQLVQGISATARVFTSDPNSERETVSFPLPLTAYDVPVPAELRDGFPRDWVEVDGTVGNSTVATLRDSGQPLKAQVVDGKATFLPASPDGDDQRVLNAFYFACRMHDMFYLLGFREKDWNFQADNGRHAGTAGDPVCVEVHPGVVNYTANMTTFVEGTSPTLQLGIHEPTRRHTALDGSVVIHEFTHGMTNRLVGGPSDVHALDDRQCRGMGEGWGDYFACTTLGITTMASWLVGSPAGIRGFPYDERFPADKAHFGKVGTGRFRDEHAVGEIWCATLLDMNRRIGKMTGLRLVMHALKLSPSNPSFLAMRDAILAATDVLVMIGDLPEEAEASTRDGIWAAFAKFGMGPAASCDDASYQRIVADFSTPVPGTTQNPFGPQRTPATITLETDLGQSISITPAAPDAEASLAVTDLRPVSAIHVYVNLEHPAPDQVRVTLRSPSGHAILHNGPTAGTHFAGAYSSDEHPALMTLLGHPAAGAWSLLVVDLVGKSSGSLRSWRLKLGLGPGSEVAEVSPRVPIPDNFVPGVESRVLLETDGAASHITVEIVITHPQPADLRLELVSPSGERAILRDLDEPASGAIQSYDSDSSQRLAALLGKGVSGQWTLRVADCLPGEVGTLERWRLTVRPD